MSPYGLRKWLAGKNRYRTWSIFGGCAVLILFGFRYYSDRRMLVLKDRDLPLKSIYKLKDGDELAFELPTGQTFTITVDRDIGTAEQSTASGLFAQINVGLGGTTGAVSTDTQSSIKYATIGRYQIQCINDLQDEYCLPVIVYVCDSTADHLLRNVDADVIFHHLPKSSGTPTRISADAVHSILIRKLGYPVRLVEIQGSLTFQVFGSIIDAPEAQKVSVVKSIAQVMFERYENIDALQSFTIQFLRDNNQVVSQYSEQRASNGQWQLITH
jgi:hypothetical protein